MIDSIICDDGLNVMKKMENDFVDFILTDPPYFVSQQIKIGRSANTKYAAKTDIDLDFGEWDHFESDEVYMEWIKVRLAECCRVLKDYCHLVFFFDVKKITTIWEYLEGIGMKGRGLLHWIKTNPVPRGRKVDFMKPIEYALWFTKKAVKQDYFNWKLGQHCNYIEHSIVGHTTKKDGERCHPTQKPIAFGEWLISYLTKENDIVLDPFCGSGTFCIAAYNLGRRYVGIDNKEIFVKKARGRLKVVQSQIKLF